MLFKDDINMTVISKNQYYRKHDLIQDLFESVVTLLALDTNYDSIFSACDLCYNGDLSWPSVHALLFHSLLQ